MFVEALRHGDVIKAYRSAVNFGRASHAVSGDFAGHLLVARGKNANEGRDDAGGNLICRIHQ
jgi:hypothetical protein